MNHLLKRGGRYYFNRRVPEEFREHDKRNYIRVALKTDSLKEANRLAFIQNNHLEQYWINLIKTNKTHSDLDYQDIVRKATLLGFSYHPNSELALASIEDIIFRLNKIENHKNDETHVIAALGGMPEPRINLTNALERYWEYSKDKVYSKSPNQYRKWKRPRQRAIDNFINVVGNKSIIEITRDDILKFRDWWLKRIQHENLVVNSANKNFIHLKVVLETVSDNLNLNMPIDQLFKKTILSEDNDQKRLPFDTDYIRKTLLNTTNLKGLNEQAKYALLSISETGAGPAEQVGLTEDDIILDSDIPHIIIRPKQKNGLKTKYRKRMIPLVGFALDAFKAYPKGFTDYADKPDRLSAVLSKYLKENMLLPTERHTVYSLRHSFQDRLLAVNAPDRVQADLMGHKFQRQVYGNGSSLKQKLEWLEKIQIKNV